MSEVKSGAPGANYRGFRLARQRLSQLVREGLRMIKRSQLETNEEIRSPARNVQRQYLLIGLISVFTILLVWAGLWLIERRLVQSSGELIAVVASDVAAKLDLVMQERQIDIKVLSASLSGSERSMAFKEGLIRAFQQISPMHLWIGMTDSNGQILLSSDAPSMGSSVKQAEWFRVVQEQGTFHVGYFHPDAYTGGTEAISLTVPMWADARPPDPPPFMGVISSRVGLPQLEALITKTIRTFQQQNTFFRSAEYQIMREDGLVLIDSDLFHKGGAVNLKKMGFVSAFLGHLGIPGFIEEEHMRRRVAVVTGYATSKWIQESTAPSWTVFVRVDRSEILGPFFSYVWLISGIGLVIVVPMLGSLVRTARRAQAGWIEAEKERARSQENEQRLQCILQAEPEGVIVVGHENQILQINPAGCVLFDAGFSEEIVGKNLKEFVHADDRRLIEETYNAAWAGHQSCGKGRFIGLSGQVRWIEITSVPLRDDHGTLQSILSVVRDVTERERGDHRQALQHTVAKVLAEASTVEQAVPALLRGIALNMGWHVGLFWLVQDERRALACAQDWSGEGTAVQDFLGASRREVYTFGSGLPGRCWARGEPLWVEDVQKDADLVRGSLEAMGTLHAACAFPIWLRANVFGVMEFFSREAHSRDEDVLKTLSTVGSQIGLFIERTEVETALHENEARTRLIIDTALDAVITLDSAGRITEWNVQAERTFGWSAPEVIGRDLAGTVISSSTRPVYYGHLHRFRESANASAPNSLLELTGLRRDGREFPIELAMTPLEIEGAIIFSAFIRDITSRKEAEQSMRDYAQQLERINHQLDAALTEAKAATEAKSSFLATMSHEIRTPMNGVIGMTGLLLDTKLTEEQREYAETVRSCGDHLLMIINDILDFSKIEAGKLDLEVIEFDLRLAIEESLDLLAERASSKGLNLACLFHADVPRNLLGDPGRLRQVVMNLTANAIKFTDRGDVVIEVTVDAQSDHDATIRVSVADTGIGISEEARGRLFQSFSQADGSTTRKYGGTGLGLAICKRLVEIMRGTIGVTSRVGEGSCFWFTVTLGKQAEASRREEASAIVLAGLRILIVDDKAINRRILELMTKKWGMQPTLVESGSKALDVLSGRDGQPRFDLALLDVDMSPTDGIELARAIKAQAIGGDPQLMLLTSFGRRGDAKTAKEAGLAAYLTKPVRERQLHDCLVAVITQRPVASGMPATRESPPLITRHTLAETKAKVDLRILLAEDNIINQRVAVRLFQRLGHRIDVVTNGREAVEAVSRTHYDVVFMDCQMPEMDGFEATREIRRHEASLVKPASPAPQGEREAQNEIRVTGDERCGAPRMLIIAMTANAMQGDREHCLAAGMDEYLTKPISKDALAQVLAQVNKEHERSQPKDNQEAA